MGGFPFERKRGSWGGIYNSKEGRRIEVGEGDENQACREYRGKRVSLEKEEFEKGKDGAISTRGGGAVKKEVGERGGKTGG